MSGQQDDPGDDLLAGMTGEASSLDTAIAEASAWIGDGVEGVGEGRTDSGQPCVVVFVASLDQATRDRIPASVDGHPVVLSATGPILAGAGPDEDGSDSDQE